MENQGVMYTYAKQTLEKEMIKHSGEGNAFLL